MWQGQVWEARPDGESTRGKAKFGKRHGSRKWEEENSSLNTKASLREGEETAENPPPPHTMCHTPHWASAGRVAFYYFVFLKRRKCTRGHFLGFLASAVVLRKGSPASAGAPQASARALADM